MNSEQIDRLWAEMAQRNNWLAGDSDVQHLRAGFYAGVNVTTNLIAYDLSRGDVSLTPERLLVVSAYCGARIAPETQVPPVTTADFEPRKPWWRRWFGG